jgi:hypothetical protein
LVIIGTQNNDDTDVQALKVAQDGTWVLSQSEWVGEARNRIEVHYLGAKVTAVSKQESLRQLRASRIEMGNEMRGKRTVPVVALVVVDVARASLPLATTNGLEVASNVRGQAGVHGEVELPAVTCRGR